MLSALRGLKVTSLGNEQNAVVLPIGLSEEVRTGSAVSNEDETTLEEVPGRGKNVEIC